MEKKLAEKYNNLPIQIKASLWYFICSFLQKGISVITTPIFTRIMSTEEYGQYNVFTSWQGIVAIFITLRLYYGVYSQGLIKFDKERNIFSSSLQGLVVTMIGFWMTIYLCFRSFFNTLFSLNTIQVVVMLVMTWTEAVYCFWAAEQRVRLNYRRLVILTVIVSFLKPTLGILLVVNVRDKVTARVLGIAFVELITYLGLFVSQMVRGKTFFSKKFWLYSIRFNIPLIPHYLSQTVLNSSDRIMISKMVGESYAGIYSLAYSISMLMSLLNTALSHTLSPWILQKIKSGKTSETAKIVYISLSFVACANLVLIAFAPEIVSVFAPASYKDAIWIIPPVAMSVYFIFAYDIFSNIEFYFEKTKFIMFASMIAAVLNVILNYIFIKPFGYFAAGYTTLLCYIAYALFHFIFMRKICKNKMDGAVPYKAKPIATITTVFLALGFAYLLTYKYIIIRFGITIIILISALINRNNIIPLVKTVFSKNK